MSDFYDDMRNIATGLLSEFKQGALAYVQITPGNGPGDDPGASVETVFPFDGTARGVKFKYINNTSIVSTDLQAVMPVGIAVPSMNGFITVDGVRHKIVEIISKPSAGNPVVFVIIFRK